MAASVNNITKIAARKTNSGYLIEVYRDGLVNTFSTKKDIDHIAVDQDGSVYGYYGAPVTRPGRARIWIARSGGGAVPLGKIDSKVVNWQSSVTPLTLALALGRSDQADIGDLKTVYTLSIPILNDQHIMTAVEKMPLGAEIVAVEYEGELLPFSFKPNRIEVHNDTITFLHSQRMAGFTAEVSFKRGTMLQVIV